MACLDVPGLSDELYKKYERQIGPAVEEAARQSCKRASSEEKQLVLDRIDEICKELPQEIAKEIAESVVVFKTNQESTQDFNEAMGQVVNIIVCYDMGWSKRGNGRSYDSLNGYGAIIGFLSGKILDYQTRNRKCRKCDLGQPKNSHDCRLNFYGSAKAMEADVGAALINRSQILQEAGLKVKVFIGDEDSSTIAAVRRERSDHVFKLADKNHLNKNFGKELYGLQAQFQEMKKREVIPHLKKCFSYAVSQNKGQSTDLAKNLRVIPDHVFGYHENCGEWCKSASGNNQSHTILLQNTKLLDALKTIFSKYADNANKFSVAASSQSNEAVNSIMSHKAPKMQCFSLSESSDYRYASTVANKNDGDAYILGVLRDINIQPGLHLEKFCKAQDNKRHKKTERSRLPQVKVRRHILAHKRSDLRRRTERQEGVQYDSNCGMTVACENIQAIFQNFKKKDLCQADCELVFFDTETSGFGKDSEILQISAKRNNSTFNVYLNPTKKIALKATEITGLRNVNGELFLRDQQLESKTMIDGLILFKEFLKSFDKPCLLVAHNASFDATNLTRAIKNNQLIRDFCNILIGFTDSLSLLRKILSDRKGQGQFKLCNLATDFLQPDENINFHDAFSDVVVLERICSLKIAENLLYENYVPFASYFSEFPDSLKNAVSKGIIKKIVDAGLTFQILQDTLSKDGELGFTALIQKSVTKRTNIVQSIMAVVQKA